VTKKLVKLPKMTRRKAKELGRKIKKVTPTEFRVMKAQSEEGLPEFS
jgi:hypothetical protein